MKLIRHLAAILFLCLTTQPVFSQKKGPLYALEKRLMRGDKRALFDLAPYFDSKKRVVEFLGYHIIPTTESEVAKRMVEENCLFTEREMVITRTTTARDFLDFLNRNSGKILFSPLAHAFLLTPLEGRTARVDFRELTPLRAAGLQETFAELTGKEWVKRATIDSLIRKRDPRALLLIASEFYKIRYRFDQAHSNQEEYKGLLQALTGFEMAVENERKELTWHPDKEFYPDAALNLLVYFAGNYHQFRWDTPNARFRNDQVQVKPIGREDQLFQLLGSAHDSVAIDAFTQLTTGDPKKVIGLTHEWEGARLKTNGGLPLFPFRFLRQLVVLTAYCRKEGIDYTGSASLRADIDRLVSELSFPERRKLEDRLIATLTLDEITALEYWALVKGES